tara:strand:+ start:376 stop:822 length:447 start_codon:yes stop_codon:yes gene_type:complete
MKILLYISLIAFLGCSSETPREKAKRYIGYVDSFYVDFTNEQEKKLDEIVDFYFDSKKEDLKVNKEIYLHIEAGLSENKKLNQKYLVNLINQKIELNKKIMPSQIGLIIEFYETLNQEQKKEMLNALRKLKGKSARMRYWLGEGDDKT